jgi:mono/diheme cytochrome c family protein
MEMKKTAVLLAVVILVAPMAAFADDVATGEKIFTEKKCSMCHGAKLEKKPINKEGDAVVKFLLEDAKHKGKVADEAAAKALAAYLKTLKK